MADWQELESKYYMRTFKRMPLTLVRGEGARVWDDRGKEYLDFTSGWGVNSLGHCHPAVVGAVCEQARTLIQTSNQFYTTPQQRLAELLVEKSCLDRVFFCNSGVEAVEGAVKLARRYGKIHLGGAYQVITAINSFHGRTLTMIAATGQPTHQEPYTPLPSGFINVEYNGVDSIKEATTAEVCAVMLEPIQGEGGVNVPDNDYLKAVRSWCDERVILLILDEVQTGIGRIGSLFGYEQYGVEPDIMALAKGLGGGVPMGAFLAKDKASVFAPGEHGSTFGGNPLACSAGYATLKFIIEDDIPNKVKQTGAYLISELERLKTKFSFITDVRGRGLLVAIQIAGDISDGILVACRERGLLLNPVKPSVIRFIPPLNITKNDVDEAIAILEPVLMDVGKEK
ncbi:MAG: aspartate aminotransferase family protein [Dehalococcoidia bacterium]|nr:MAG: aspartate aminotransferase family protein [Dehalococcoidia bacterium]